MNDERTFRSAFWALLGAAVLMRGYFTFRVHRAWSLSWPRGCRRRSR